MNLNESPGVKSVRESSALPFFPRYLAYDVGTKGPDSHERAGFAARICLDDMKIILFVFLTLVFILAFDSRSSAASVSGKVVEIHYGAGTSNPADQVIVTLYRMNQYLDRPDGPKVASLTTKIDGLFHFDNIPKGEYLLRVRGVKSWGPELGPEVDRRISILTDDAAVEPETIVIDYKDSPPG
jgi:hypothetical protein